jgi:hypothetical protein
MDDAIRGLLDVLEAAEDAGVPLTDTDIREGCMTWSIAGSSAKKKTTKFPPACSTVAGAARGKRRLCEQRFRSSWYRRGKMLELSG